MKPLISLIVPAYNHQNYIKDCIYSLIAQDYENLELIIINDGSTDSTHLLIEEMSEQCRHRFSKYTYINQSNMGVAKTLNTGLGISSGEFVFILASDDMAIECDVITVLADVLILEMGINAKVAGSCCDMAIIDSMGKAAYWNDDRSLSYKYVAGENYNTTLSFYTRWRREFDGFDYLSSNFGSYSSILVGHYMPNGVLLRRDCLFEVGLYSDGILVEDWDMWLKLSKKFTFKLINRPMLACRWHSSNTQIQRHKKIVKDIYRLVKEQREYCLNNSLEKVWKVSFRLARSQVLSAGEVIFLLKNTSVREWYIYFDDLIFVSIIIARGILKKILPLSVFESVKRVVRKIFVYRKI